MACQMLIIMIQKPYSTILWSEAFRLSADWAKFRRGRGTGGAQAPRGRHAGPRPAPSPSFRQGDPSGAPVCKLSPQKSQDADFPDDPKSCYCHHCI